MRCWFSFGVDIGQSRERVIIYFHSPNEEIQEGRKQRKKEEIYDLLVRWAMNSTQQLCHILSMDEV